MISDAPVGAFLSGGLDSSSVVAFAKEVNPKIECFTYDTDGNEKGLVDDLPYAKKVANYLKVPLEIIKVDSQKLCEDFESMIIQLDEPLADPAALNVKYISHSAKKKGIKVLLSGAGGDDIFSGYRRHKAIKLQSIFRIFPKKSSLPFWKILHLDLIVIILSKKVLQNSSMVQVFLEKKELLIFLSE